MKEYTIHLPLRAAQQLDNQRRKAMVLLSIKAYNVDTRKPDWFDFWCVRN